MTPPGSEDALTDVTSELSSASADLIEEISTHAIFRLTPDGTIATWSDSANALYGYDPTTIVQDHLSVLFADEEGPNPDLADHLLKAKTGSTEIEHWNKRADGSVFWASLTISPLGDSGAEGYVVISQDTTEKKQYEQMLERQNDRLKEFTNILAHDLRTPLNSIDGRLELYKETNDEEHISKIEETTERMERLVDDLLRVAQQGDVITDPKQIDLEAVINTAWDGTGKTRPDAELLYSTVPSVAADQDRLCELFENLFRNAMEHGGEDVTVRIGPLKNGFFIEDDGPGIPAEIQEDVFDHGYTTMDSSSGYGLSIVRTIINAHGWDVRATASDSGGARFEITGVEFLD